MSNTEYKVQKNFVKDGDDEVVVRKHARRVSNNKPRQLFKTCECSGKFKPFGSIGINGYVSFKCNRCGHRSYSKIYKGVAGLVKCY